MINIILKELHDKEDPQGPADYIVTNNGKPYTTVTHTVAHGIPSLLRCAAIAFEMKANEDVRKEIEEMAQ